MLGCVSFQLLFIRRSRRRQSVGSDLPSGRLPHRRYYVGEEILRRFPTNGRQKEKVLQIQLKSRSYYASIVVQGDDPRPFFTLPSVTTIPLPPKKKKICDDDTQKIGRRPRTSQFCQYTGLCTAGHEKKMNQYEIIGYKANLFSLFSVADPLVLGRGRTVDLCDCPISF